MNEALPFRKISTSNRSRTRNRCKFSRPALNHLSYRGSYIVTNIQASNKNTTSEGSGQPAHLRSVYCLSCFFVFPRTCCSTGVGVYLRPVQVHKGIPQGSRTEVKHFVCYHPLSLSLSKVNILSLFLSLPLSHTDADTHTQTQTHTHR